MLDPLPLPAHPTFDDLVFRPHRDGLDGHTHALHKFSGERTVSVTCGGRNFGTPEAPYEMQAPDGEIHAPLTSQQVTNLLQEMA
jgi:hypothetical protein